MTFYSDTREGCRLILRLIRRPLFNGASWRPDELSRRELFSTKPSLCSAGVSTGLEATMHGIIYIVGLIVVLLAVLSFFGLR